MAFPMGLPKNAFLAGKLSKIWKMPLLSTTPTMMPSRKRRTGGLAIQKAKKAIVCYKIYRHLIFDAFFVYTFHPKNHETMSTGYP